MPWDRPPSRYGWNALSALRIALAVLRHCTGIGIAAWDWYGIEIALGLVSF